MSANKQNLTFEEQITCAYLHYVRGVTQEILATAYATNQGRVNEACLTIKDALVPRSRIAEPTIPGGRND